MQQPCFFAARCGAQRISRLATAAAARVSSSPAIMRCAMSSSTSSNRLLTVHASATATRALHSGSLPVSSTLTQRKLSALPTSLTALRTMRGAATIVVPARASFFAGAAVSPMATACSSLFAAQRCYGVARATRVAHSPKKSSEGGGQLQGVNKLARYKGEEEDEQKDGSGNEQESPFNMNSGPGYLPFPPPFHTINIVMILFLANVMCYLIMNLGNDDWRDFVVEHCTLSHENWTRIYPLFTNAFYQENILQLLIDCWLLWQFGDTMLGFLGNTRMTFFALLCTLGGSVIHVARQKFELYYGMDELEVRGRCYGPNPFIMGLVAIEGLIFRHLNFIQQPPIPFLVLTAFVMVIDVWRIFTTKPEEHGAATGGALMAYLFWALPTRMLGLDKLTATL
ncbi:tyrosine phospatase-like protein [Leishmania donovani]|uniref:Tyrosine_phospatase-like_protein/GeneDB:LmjF.04.0 840 n=1 Tax=Leishmania donovani TaxID=5661 RepID=A0A6J8F6E9_LEIDO|nr:tyrosine phospatase-like protein [Leishmania donovani]VDZ41834.1 tyrosine_phospatase-like_protein/GeneDB:LmjF.04.0840 [Leishmania donovani]